LQVRFGFQNVAIIVCRDNMKGKHDEGDRLAEVELAAYQVVRTKLLQHVRQRVVADRVMPMVEEALAAWEERSQSFLEQTKAEALKAPEAEGVQQPSQQDEPATVRPLVALRAKVGKLPKPPTSMVPDKGFQVLAKMGSFKAKRQADHEPGVGLSSMDEKLVEPMEKENTKKDSTKGKRSRQVQGEEDAMAIVAAGGSAASALSSAAPHLLDSFYATMYSSKSWKPDEKDGPDPWENEQDSDSESEEV
jgi:hypothetical protein